MKKMLIRSIVWFAAVVIVEMLGGCAGQPIYKTQIQYVDRPVKMSCLPADLPPDYTYPDTDDGLKGAKDGADRYLMLYEGRKLRISRNALLESLLSNCK